MDLDVTEIDDRDVCPYFSKDVSAQKVDLFNHISHFQGLPRIYRLEFIADQCENLRLVALNCAVEYIKAYTYNVKDYTRLYPKLVDAYFKVHQHFGGVGNIDRDWIDRKTKRAALRFERLENDLRNFRTNSMKENIRRAQDDLGDHYLDCGELEKAATAYAGSRDYVTTQRNQINQCLNMIKVNILLKKWLVVSNHVLRAESQPNNDTTANPAVSTQLHCAAGLFELHSRRYKRAAKHFLSTNFDHFNQPNPIPTNDNGLLEMRGAPSPREGSSISSSSSNHNLNESNNKRDHPSSAGQWDILAPISIAEYGSICALATYSRQELANHLINSVSFKQFSELDPQLREAVSCFYESKYASCLSILQDIKMSLQLDMYLAPHVERLYKAIRTRALVQYFEPYSTACMNKMAAAFNTTVEALEGEITALIYDGHIKARIDSHNKILYAKNTDSRTQTFEKAIKFGKLWQRNAQALITRTAVLNAGLVVYSSVLPDRTGS